MYTNVLNDFPVRCGGQKIGSLPLTPYLTNTNSNFKNHCFLSQKPERYLLFLAHSCTQYLSPHQTSYGASATCNFTSARSSWCPKEAIVTISWGAWRIIHNALTRLLEFDDQTPLSSEKINHLVRLVHFFPKEPQFSWWGPPTQGKDFFQSKVNGKVQARALTTTLAGTGKDPVTRCHRGFRYEKVVFQTFLSNIYNEITIMQSNEHMPREVIKHTV